MAKFSLRPGSIIKFKRKYYCHYGVYYKRNKVVHFNGTLEEKKESSVVLSNLNEVWGEPYIVGDTFYDLEPMNVNEVMNRCHDMLETERKDPYNVLWNNCEHMATYIRYGKKVSKQVKNFSLFLSIISFIFLSAKLII